MTTTDGTTTEAAEARELACRRERAVKQALRRLCRIAVDDAKRTTTKKKKA